MPIAPNEPYTFSRYFEQQIDAIDLGEYFGYSYQVEPLNLLRQTSSRSDQLSTVVARLQLRLGRVIESLVSAGEQAKREMLIAPLIAELIDLTQGINLQIRIEYSIKVSDQLQGNLDYLLSQNNLQQLLVIEAKRDDLDYGTTQLFAELIALDQWERSPLPKVQPFLVGAISTGRVWQFAVLDRARKALRKGLELYRVPEDLENVLQILFDTIIGENDAEIALRSSKKT